MKLIIIIQLFFSYTIIFKSMTINSDHNLTVGGTYYLNSDNAFYLYVLVTASNESLFGDSNFGLMAGIDYPVINDKIRVKGEIMTGKHWMNGVNIGGQYEISKSMLAGLGFNLLNFNDGPSPFILQLHYNM